MACSTLAVPVKCSALVDLPHRQKAVVYIPLKASCSLSQWAHSNGCTTCL